MGLLKRIAEEQEKRLSEKYVVLQCVLNEDLIGTGSTVSSMMKVQGVINRQCERGYRLHTFTTVSSGSKGLMGGDRIQATMVFERIENE